MSSFEQIVDALADLGFDSFVLLDKAEPESKTFASLVSTGFKLELVALLGVSTGLIDYQLAEGGAAKLWEEVEGIATQVAVANPDDIRHCMELLLRTPVCSLYREQKARRIDRLFSSDVPAHIADNFAECIGEPAKLWKTIADVVQSSPEKKTIAFAMKAFDLAVFARSGRYLAFEEEPPIAVDFHIRRVSEILGLTSPEVPDDEIRHLWFRVSTEVSVKTGKSISPFRIDSLIWQTGVSTYDPKVKKHMKSQLEKLERHLAEIGIPKARTSKFLTLLRSSPF